jgi:hypothetical protein
VDDTLLNVCFRVTSLNRLAETGQIIESSLRQSFFS